MKNLTQFISFRIEDFLKEKRLVVVGCRPWTDNNSKDVLGTKVDVVIIVDNTHYERKDGKQVTNRFEKLTLKVPKEIEFPADTEVKAVQATAKVYGEYQHLLTITCEDVVAVQPSSKA